MKVFPLIVNTNNISRRDNHDRTQVQAQYFVGNYPDLI